MVRESRNMGQPQHRLRLSVHSLSLELYHQSTRSNYKRNGITYCSESDTEHSTGRETLFDYDQVEEELAKEIYAERDAGIVCV